MIFLKDISYNYKKNFTIEVSLKINKGERISIFGPSGSGKSTLIHLIAGFLFSNTGKILINKKDYTNYLSSERPISTIFQENNLFYHLNVITNISLGINPKLKFSLKEKKRIKKIAKKLNLYDYLYHLPEQLSVGQRQLVAIARCLLRNKPILLLDEPFSSLDLLSKTKIINLLKNFCNDKQITLIVVLHNFEDAIKIAKRSLLIIKGKTYWDGKTINLIKENKKFF